MTAEVSHGRGGAGNINPDDTHYVDGEVVRAGVIGSHGDGAYSAGRGGAGNIGDKGHPPTDRKDRDIIPEAAVRQSTDTGDYHTGRGGAGNEHTSAAHQHHGNGHKDPEGAAAAAPPGKEQLPPPPVGLADKLKGKLFGAFK
ncbi:hypothetical protein CCM_06914 [Cordyceps militaris CM01]|uniref:Uncharacterized protein n=1 Tax=Cordyceps militaris (strain CM01) TaxID=983644 RepID=G3JLC0_CORMM|nr:uncharacterized protein CCM_06914 [Cordyceps militaris CM01]EGX90494.1 hypothetical protein CCM_06914 [Cordyceps militaris CM01]